MLFLTVHHYGVDRNSYFAVADQGLDRLAGIVGGFFRYVSLYFANLSQSRSAFIRAPYFYFICHISSIIFVCRLLATSFCVPLPPRFWHRS